jgi:CDP-diacylglycerol--serine O-phosphatidyltransferase
VSVPAALTLIYTFVIAGLMISRLPVLSGKKYGARVPRELVMPVILVAVCLIALLVSYPWYLLTAGTIVYLALLPLGWVSRQRYLAADAEALRAKTSVVTQSAQVEPPASPPPEHGDERPVRLN